MRSIIPLSIVALLCLPAAEEATVRVSTSQSGQSIAAPTCQEARNELARFSSVYTEYGSTLKHDPTTGSRYSNADGESFWIGRTIYLSKGRFKEAERQLSADPGVTERTTIMDAKGNAIGQRLVQEDRARNLIHIWRITNRMVDGIAAPTLKLALTIETANLTCLQNP